MASLLTPQQVSPRAEFPAYLLSNKRILGREIGLIALRLLSYDGSSIL
jgi:hypothetical protein